MSEMDLHAGRSEEIKRVARILRIIQLVSAQPRRWTRRQLAEHFEFSERMIDKDLEIIRNGLCFDLRRAREGYYFSSGPLLKPIETTVPEVLALALAAQQARDTGTVDSSVIASALSRLEGALPAGILPYLRRIGDATPVPFGPVRERGETLLTLRQAMAEGRKVEIVYLTASRGGARSTRLLAPYYLHPYERSWLAVAQDSLRGTILMFKVDRMERCELTQEPYTIPDGFDPIEYLGPAWGVLRGESGPPEDVVLRFTAHAGRWVCDERWHPTQTAETLPGGDLIMRFHCGVTHELERWVLSFGSEVRVEEPDHLRQAVLREARRTAEMDGDERL